MDNMNLPNPSGGLQKLLNRKNIFIALGAILALEIIWAGLTLLRPVSPATRVSEEVAVKTTSVSLLSPRASLKVGEKVTVDINISSGSKVEGADLLINYDPNLLSAEPVVAGVIFRDFPVNKVDKASGRITVSGITDTSGGVLADGLFGSVDFTAKAAGVAKISLEFSPGQTTDSNLIETGTGKDILEEVSDLDLNILP